MKPREFEVREADLIKINTITSKGICDVRIVRRANILSCFHKGYRSTEIAEILNTYNYDNFDNTTIQ